MITGCPVILNTSFNENEPIVQTPEEVSPFERIKNGLFSFRKLGYL